MLATAQCSIILLSFTVNSVSLTFLPTGNIQIRMIIEKKFTVKRKVGKDPNPFLISQKTQTNEKVLLGSG